MACPLQLANYLCILLVLGKKHLQLTDDPPLKLIPAFVQSQPSLYVWISVPIPKDIWRIPYISGCVRNVFRIRKWLNSWTSSCMKWPLPFQSWWSNSRYFRYFTFVKSCLIFVQDFSTDNAFKYLERYKKNIPFSMMISKGQEPSSSVASWMRLNSLRWHLVNPYRHTASCSLGQDQQESE